MVPMDALRDRHSPAATVTPSSVVDHRRVRHRGRASTGGAARELRRAPAAPRRTPPQAA